MLRKHLLVALLVGTPLSSLLASPNANAGSWSYVGTLPATANVADGVYEVRLTLVDAATSRSLLAPVTVHGVAVSGGAFSVKIELDAALRPLAGSSAGKRVLITELSSDGAHFIAINPSSPFDAASAQLGVCWGSSDAGSTSANASVSSCLLPSDLLTQMGPSGGVYALTKQLIAGGGRLVTGGSYSLVGSVGQSAVAKVSGGSYQITGGFHSAAAGPPFDLIFRSGFDN